MAVLFYALFFFIMVMAINNNMTKEKIASAIFNALKGKASKQNIDKIMKYIWGESLSMKKVLSRDHMILKEEFGDSSNKSEKEEQTSDGQEEQNPGEPDDELGALPSESTSGQEAANTEEISADEIKICLAAAPDEFQKEIDSLKK